MAESTGVRTKRDISILIYSAAAAQSYTISKEIGDLNITIPLQTVNHFLDRGELGSTPSIRLGDDQPMTLAWSAYLRDLGDTANSFTTLIDLGVAYAGRFVETNWVSRSANVSDVFTVAIAITLDGTPFGEADKTLTFDYCVFRTGGIKDGDPSSVDCTATSYQLRPTLS